MFRGVVGSAAIAPPLRLGSMGLGFEGSPTPTRASRLALADAASSTGARQHFCFLEAAPRLHDAVDQRVPVRVARLANRGRTF